MTAPIHERLRELSETEFQFKEDAFDAGQEALRALPDILAERDALTARAEAAEGRVARAQAAALRSVLPVLKQMRDDYAKDHRGDDCCCIAEGLDVAILHIEVSADGLAED